MKVALILPGWQQKMSEKKYQTIVRSFSKQGIKPISVTISWKRITVKQYAEQVLNEYKFEKGTEVYIYGFSYGAIVALICSLVLKPKVVILSSLSPYFKEDLNRIPKWWKTEAGKNNLRNFEKMKFSDFPKSIAKKVIIIAGDKEGPEVMYRALVAHEHFKNNQLVIVSKGKHDVGQPEYAEVLKEVISKL